jgi:hypothetical protein
VRRTPQSVSVIQVAGDAASTNALIASQRTTGSLNILNLPADEPAAEALRALGARTVVQQRELVLSL